jgi:hypothetical protein
MQPAPFERRKVSDMDLPIENDVIQLMQAYHTGEFLTVSKSGTPIAWPVAGAINPETGKYVVSTSIGFPQKAINVRRDPRVALLFSDPTGSDVLEPQQLLLQGIATSTQVVESGFVSHSFLWRRLLTIQPPAKRSADFLTRTLMAPYFMRLFITVDPQRISLLPAHSPVPRSAAQPLTSKLMRKVVGELRNYDSAVLAAFDASGNPTLARTTPAAVDGTLRLEGLDATSLREGRASLLAHTHDEHLGSLRSFVTSGSLSRSAEGWRFSPERFIAGQSGGVLASIRFLRNLHRTAASYLEHRNLPRPEVPWSELAALNDEVNSGTARV